MSTLGKRAPITAEDDFGEKYTDLTPAALDALVVYVTSTGGYLTVESSVESDGFIQVVLEGSAGGSDVWFVEVSQQSPASSSFARVSEIELAQKALRAWAFEPEWRDVLEWIEP